MDCMRMKNPDNNRSVYVLRLLVIALIAASLYTLYVLEQASKTYDQVSAAVSKEPRVTSTVEINDKKLNVPSFVMFKPGQLWALVSRDKPLSAEAGYELIDIPVAHGDADKPMKVARDISNGLQQLVNAAEEADEPLMISSAYRSINEQQQLQDSFVKKNGSELAALYVLPPGASEHHTGLSVDFSSVSDPCSKDSESCSLSQSGAAWLDENAFKYGFIQRYPEGKQPITGVGFEPWHYRFVGKPLALAMHNSDLTFDEVVRQIAPGYAGKQSDN